MYKNNISTHFLGFNLKQMNSNYLFNHVYSFIWHHDFNQSYRGDNLLLISWLPRNQNHWQECCFWFRYQYQENFTLHMLYWLKSISSQKLISSYGSLITYVLVFLIFRLMNSRQKEIRNQTIGWKYFDLKCFLNQKTNSFWQLCCLCVIRKHVLTLLIWVLKHIIIILDGF